MKKSFLPLLLSVVLAWPALATTPAVDHPGALPILLGLDKVRAELKLDSLQRAVLDSLRDEYKSETRKLTNPMPTTPEGRAAAEKSFVQLNERFNKRAVSALNSSQRKRLAEIEHQVLGATALYVPSVQKKVGLTEKQKQQVEAIRQSGLEYVGKINHQFEDGRIGYQDRVGLLRARRLSQGTSLLKLLTPEQRDLLVSLGGGKFSI